MNLQGFPTSFRFWAKVDGGDVAECWEWTGFRNDKGYGMVAVQIDGLSTTRRAHRLAYEHLIGAIPDGLETDHLCLNTGCVNPWHVELVTKPINVLRQHERRAALRPDTCANGHAWTQENTYWNKSRIGTPVKVCRECTRQAGRRTRQRQAQAA